MEEKLPLISIIMPAYNVEKFIERTIKSIIAQTYKHWELIIIDDGSTDGTKKIIDTYLNIDTRIKYVYQENGRQGKARNKGIENAQSDLIAFMDSDDMLLPEMLQEQFTLLKQTNADLVFSSVDYVDEDLHDLEVNHGFSYNEIEGESGAEILLCGDNPIPIITVLARKASIIKAGMFPVSSQLQFGEEYSLWLRMLLNNSRFVRNDKNMAIYVMHPGQSSKNSGDKYLQVLQLIKDLPAPAGFKKIQQHALGVWIRRCLRYDQQRNVNSLRKIIQYIPNVFSRKLCYISAILLPATMLRKMIYSFSYTGKQKNKP